MKSMTSRSRLITHGASDRAIKSRSSLKAEGGEGYMAQFDSLVNHFKTI